MAATFATLIVEGKSGQTYTVDCAVPDAVATQWTFNPSGLATTTSPVYWKAPEPCVITDIIVLAAPTATVGVLTLSGAIYTGKVFRHTNQLASLQNRAKLKIPIPAGEQVGVLQA